MAGVFAWLGAAIQHSELSFTTLPGAGVNLVPPAIVILGVGVLTFGIRPRATSIVVYGVLGWSLLLVIVGGIGAINHWVLDTSVFHHMASAPAVPPELGGERHHDCRSGWRQRSLEGWLSDGETCKGNDRRAQKAPIPRRSQWTSGPWLSRTSRPGPGSGRRLSTTSPKRVRRATIRAIAQTAGVSPGLLRHHFGSKDALRVACDEYAFEMLHRVNAQLLEDPGARPPPSRHRSGSVVTWRDRWLTGRRLRADLRRDGHHDRAVACRSDATRPDSRHASTRIRAALVTAMKIGIPLLQEHVSRTLGVEMFEPEGERLVALALLDIYSHALIDGGIAASAGLGFEEPQP